nr:hypothetical protein [Tanacetum cinerariifolium]
MDQNIDSSSFDQIQSSQEYLEKFPDAVTTVLPTEEPEYSLSMGYKHPNTTPEKESDEIIKSGVEDLVPIPREYDVTLEDKRECDVPVCENSPIFDDHSEIFSDSNNDDISSDDDTFEDIEYIEASLPDPELVSLDEENDVYQEDKEIILHMNSRLLEIKQKRREVVAPLLMLMNLFLKEVNLFLALDNSIPPGIENFGYDSEGDIRFLEELLVDNSIPSSENELSDFDHDNLLFPRPPSKPPDVEFLFDLKPEVISVVMNNIDELNEDECFDPGGEIDDEDDDYFPFMFVI